MTDEEIMARYAEGDCHSFKDIFARWAPRLHGYFLRVTGASGEADDLLRATFLKVHRARAAWSAGRTPIRRTPFGRLLGRSAAIDAVQGVGLAVRQ